MDAPDHCCPSTQRRCRSVQDKDAKEWPFADTIVPPMKAQAKRSLRDDVATEPGEEGPVPEMDISTLAAHLGLTPTELLHAVTAVDVPTPSRAPPCPVTLDHAPCAVHRLKQLL